MRSCMNWALSPLFGGWGGGVAIRLTTIDNMVVVVREIVFASISHI